MLIIAIQTATNYEAYFNQNMTIIISTRMKHKQINKTSELDLSKSERTIQVDYTNNTLGLQLFYVRFRAPQQLTWVNYKNILVVYTAVFKYVMQIKRILHAHFYFISLAILFLIHTFVSQTTYIY